MRFAANVVVLEDRLVLAIVQPETDDDAMHSRHASRLVAPLKRSMGEMNLHSLRQQPAPQQHHLLPLRDAIGRDKGTTGQGSRGVGVVHEVRCLHIPGCHEVEQASARDRAKHKIGVRPLLAAKQLRARKRRIPQHIAALARRQHVLPFEPQSIAIHDVRRGSQRDAREVQAELLAGQHVHLVVHEPQRDLRDLSREFLDFDAVELVHVQR